MSERIRISAHQTGNGVCLSFPKDKTLFEVMRSLPAVMLRDQSPSPRTT